MTSAAPRPPVPGVPRRLDFAALGEAYRGGMTVTDLITEISAALDRRGDDGVWIARVAPADLEARAARLDAGRAAGDDLPLFGIPFAVKDNIDVAGMPTTAGCPDFAYVPERSATVVGLLEAAGAILIGKTNLDQFATGLVGVRTPFGVPANPFDPAYVPGGSSSGSAVAVGAGLVSFALGTDTAGSGRVPAAFNNIVGLKPTRGLIAATGLVPACRSLDCISIFALTTSDAADVLAVAAAPDPRDAFSRGRPIAGPAPMPGAASRLGVPRADQLEFFGDDAAAAQFDRAVDRARGLGCAIFEIDYAPFRETAALLYDGPWVAERYAAVGDFIEANPGAALPVIEGIVRSGARPSARDAFEAAYRLAALRRVAEATFEKVDALLLPTAGTIYSLAQLEADPVALNTNLGFYTNFMNLLDMAGIAVPAGMRPDGLPFGVTLAAPAFSEPLLIALGTRMQQAAGLTLGATGHALPPPAVAEPHGSVAEATADDEMALAIFGAHLRGQPLNSDLVRLGARFIEAGQTAPAYRLYALPGGPPARPGLVRVTEDGAAIDLEVWAMPRRSVGDLLGVIAAPLGLGSVELADGRVIKGFICEGYVRGGAEDITGFGGWRGYLAAGRSTETKARAH